jgi:hypothetical protein
MPADDDSALARPPSRGGLWVALVALATVAGAALRFAAIDFGLPDRFRPDEQYIVERAAELGGGRGFDPHFAEYPHAEIYLVWGLAHAAQALSGTTWSTHDPEGRRRWYLTGRLASATMGALTVPLTAAVAAAAVGGGVRGPAAALAAVLAAGAFVHARDSHFATTDVAMTFWSMAAWLGIAAALRRGRLRDSLRAGALVGLAAATKYPAITLAVPLALAHAWGRGRAVRLAVAAMAVALTVVLVTPYVFLDLDATRAAIARKGGHLLTHTALAPGGAGWLLGQALPAALGWPLAVLSLAAFTWALVRGGRLERCLALWLLVAAIPLLTAQLVFIRYTVPLVPVMLVLIATTVARVGAQRPRLAAALAAAALAALGPSVARAVAVDRLLARTDTRTEARVWMEGHLPPGTLVYSPAFGVEVMAFALPEPSSFRYAPAGTAVQPGAYVLVAEHPLHHAHPPTLALATALRRDATLVLDVDPFTIDPFKPGAAVVPRYEEADAFFVPLSGFAAVSRPGPRLRLYRMPP